MPELDTSEVDPERVPVHVGMILDGNGRWAQERGLPRTAGHAAGEGPLFDSVDGALAVGLRWLSAYTFSTENWSRDPEEVEFLMWFNEDILLRRRDGLHEKGVRLRFIGELDDPRVPERNRRHMAETEELTKDNDRLTFVFAFNYGGRVELVRAIQQIARRAREGDLDPSAIGEADIARSLYIPDMPDPDLILRTSGEQRISNFLLWGSAYAELLFLEKRWPEFTAQDLVDAVVEYQSRGRRFGSA